MTINSLEVSHSEAENNIVFLRAGSAYNSQILSRSNASENYNDLTITGNNLYIRTATADQGAGSAERIVISHTTGNMNLVTGALLINGTARIDSSGFIKPVTSTIALAPNSSCFINSATGKLCFKNSSGVGIDLY